VNFGAQMAKIGPHKAAVTVLFSAPSDTFCQVSLTQTSTLSGTVRDIMVPPFRRDHYNAIVTAPPIRRSPLWHWNNLALGTIWRQRYGMRLRTVIVDSP